MDKETTIQGYMKSLEISKEEAEQLWEDDQEDYIGEEAEEMTQKAKSVMRTIHSAETDKTKRKKNEPRERKENLSKRKIIQKLFEVAQELGEGAEITNIEKYITFQMDGETFEINLIQRGKKGLTKPFLYGIIILSSERR